MQMCFDLENESIYEALQSLRIREDLIMCKCTVSCILYHINANIKKKYQCSHTSWFTPQEVFHVHDEFVKDTNWGYYFRLYFRVHVILNDID